MFRGFDRFLFQIDCLSIVPQDPRFSFSVLYDFFRPMSYWLLDSTSPPQEMILEIKPEQWAIREMQHDLHTSCTKNPLSKFLVQKVFLRTGFHLQVQDTYFTNDLPAQFHEIFTKSDHQCLAITGKLSSFPIVERNVGLKKRYILISNNCEIFGSSHQVWPSPDFISQSFRNANACFQMYTSKRGWRTLSSQCVISITSDDSSSLLEVSSSWFIPHCNAPGQKTSIMSKRNKKAMSRISHHQTKAAHSQSTAPRQDERFDMCATTSTRPSVKKWNKVFHADQLFQFTNRLQYDRHLKRAETKVLVWLSLQLCVSMIISYLELTSARNRCAGNVSKLERMCTKACHFEITASLRRKYQRNAKATKKSYAETLAQANAAEDDEPVWILYLGLL